MQTKITTPNNFRDNYILVIDSLDRDIAKYSTPSEYVVKLPVNLRNTDTIELMSLQLTRTETNVNSGNKSFSVTISATTYTVTLTEEDIASGANLASYVQTAIRTATGDNTFTVTYSSTTRKLTIGHPTTIFSIDVGENSARLLGMLATTGFRGAGSITASAIGGGAYAIAGTRIVDLSGTPYLILTMNDYDRVLSPSNAAQKSFLVVPMENYTVGQRFVICGDEKEKKGIYILTNNQKNLFELRVSFKRPDGSLYDFAGVDHVMTFRVYRHDFHDYNS